MKINLLPRSYFFLGVFFFTETEIKNAQAPSINNYINNFYANVEGMDLQQGNSK